MSNVLNRPERVTEVIRERVQRTMNELGFVRNESARHLRSGVSRTLAYVMLDASNPFFTDVAHGVEGAADSASLSLLLCNSGNDAQRERAHLTLLQQQRVQGVLITPVDPDADVLRQLRQTVPVVLVDRSRNDDAFCTVAADDVVGGRIAIEHLIDRGHTRVAFIGGPSHLGQIRDRVDGARLAWAVGGLPDRDLLVVDTTALDVAQGFAAGEHLALLPAAIRPTAVACANDLLALGLLQHAIGAGIRVPQQLAIVGYDDIDFASAAAVPLTSVRQPRRELGLAAAELLIREAAGEDHDHQQVLFTPELIARSSTVVSDDRRPT
ncbi:MULTISPECIES: LacI family DNA-binding transcriptional regulator [unclassified Nocardioides]|uniref:LacI family DNA-binding transcriptional regulator n=1 Tax=unclassified Nocardioides TaxID=2615069 RepID=UPI003014FD5C